MRFSAPTAPDTNRTKDDIPIMEMPFSGEYAATVEAKQTTLGKTSTQARNSVTTLTIDRSDQKPDQDGDTGRDNEGRETITHAVPTILTDMAVVPNATLGNMPTTETTFNQEYTTAVETKAITPDTNRIRKDVPIVETPFDGGCADTI